MPHISNSKEIVYLGLITEERGIFKMVEAINLCKTNVTLNLCGEFSNKSLRDKVIKTAGWDRINEFSIDRKKKLVLFLINLQQDYLLFYQYQIINSQPNKLFEYMSAGIPVIASNFTLWEKIIISNNCGFLS